MTAYNWKGATGDWKSKSDWTPAGGPPKSTDSATIGGTGTFTVTVDSADVAKSLTLSDANATVNDTGSLKIGGAFSFSAGVFNIGVSSTPGSLSVGGTFAFNGGALNVDDGNLTLGGTLNESSGSITLGSSGTISGGTLDVTGGAFNWDGGTLSGVTYEGALNLIGSSSTGFVTNGLTMAGSNGSGFGTINVTGPNASLDFGNTETISNATINLGNSAGYNDYLDEYDTANTGNAVLTLASSDIVHVQGNAQITSRLSGDGIVNRGLIEQTGNSGVLYIEPSSHSPIAARSTPRRRTPPFTLGRPRSPTAARSISPTATRSASRRRSSRPRRRASLRSGRIHRRPSTRPTPGAISARLRWPTARASFSTDRFPASARSRTPAGRSTWKGP